jgi:hypothetical protein
LPVVSEILWGEWRNVDASFYSNRYIAQLWIRPNLGRLSLLGSHPDRLRLDLGPASVVGILPRPAVEPICKPFMNQIMLGPLPDTGGGGGITQDRHAFHARRNLFEKFLKRLPDLPGATDRYPNISSRNQLQSWPSPITITSSRRRHTALLVGCG